MIGVSGAIDLMRLDTMIGVSGAVDWCTGQYDWSEWCYRLVYWTL